MTSLAGDLRFRGLIHQVTDPDLPARLDAGPLTLYAGFDPTAPSLHVGNLLQLCTLRRFQLAGHRPIALAGGATGRIGDPGGKADERPLQSDEQIRANLEGIRPQLARFVDFGADAGIARGLLVDNATWLGSMPLVDFLRDVGKHFTVNQMVGKESVRSRFERPDQGISYTEFSYMLMQAYDFLRLHLDHGCDLQIGGSDQWGNITMGVELVRKVARHEVYGLTSPLVLKADGTKFGKTEAGTVWLDRTLTSPYRLYQFFYNTEDAVVGTYLRFFTFLSSEQIEDLDAETATRPQARAAARALSRAVTTLVHGPDEVARVERASTALFGAEIADLDEATLLEVVADAPTTEVSRSELVGGALSLVDMLVRSGLATSRADARRKVDGGGVYVNNRRESDAERALGPEDLLHDRYVVLRRGRRDYNLVIAG